MDPKRDPNFRELPTYTPHSLSFSSSVPSRGHLEVRFRAPAQAVDIAHASDLAREIGREIRSRKRQGQGTLGLYRGFMRLYKGYVGC